MANRRSTVEFTDVIEPLLAELEISGFDIRAVVNAGILLFSKLSGDQQKQAIAEANGANPDVEPEKSMQEALAKIKQIIEIEKECPGTISQIMSKEDCARFDQFRRLMSLNSKKQKNAKRG